MLLTVITDSFATPKLAGAESVLPHASAWGRGYVEPLQNEFGRRATVLVVGIVTELLLLKRSLTLARQIAFRQRKRDESTYIRS